ncbi:MAG: sigma-70 family RNA polymerase sigma factor [Ruminococcus sp.]|nr:sigma-70 family RNA polymerase sigma factor [Ruminococcus sp.]
MLSVCMTLIDDDGGREAFKAVFEKYKQRVYSVAYSILKDEALAEESTQETFFYIAKNFSLIQGLEPVQRESYMIIAAKNIALSAYRKEKKHLSCEPVGEELLDDSSMSAYDRAEIRTALEALDYEDREVLYMHYALGLSFKSIGSSLGISAAAARKRAQYARASFKAYLEGGEDL